MEQTQVARINFLAGKAKSGNPLTEEELREQAELRDLYRAEQRANVLKALADNYQSL